jgi:HD superfamily phosphohydrolase
MKRLTLPPLEIRCPVHGAIAVDAAEAAIVDHRAVQRLRGVRQLGFSHLPFPGATHTRFSHSLGAMHLAGAAFDSVFRDQPFPTEARRLALRRCVRIAALCHDLGHAPYSHAAEFAMPPLRALGLRAYAPARVRARLDERAHHEDYTVAILTESSLQDAIELHLGCSAAHVAALISDDVGVPDDFFVQDGYDLRGLLSQLISSELDVDRLDYLQRDSLYTGARYGQIDATWLISHLARHVDDRNQVGLALDNRALYALDDFLLSRFHMFLMVYFHGKSVVYEEMLKRWVLESDTDLRLPAAAEDYLDTDDAWLWARLRASDSAWARRITRYAPYKVAFEEHGSAEQTALDRRVEALRHAGLDPIPSTAWGHVLGKGGGEKAPLYIIGETGRNETEARTSARRLADLTPGRLGRPEGAGICRIYVAPEQLDLARAQLAAVWQQQPLLLGS